jgi:hypothetical protein
MELPEYHEPRSILVNLLLEYLELSLSESEPFSILPEE